MFAERFHLTFKNPGDAIFLVGETHQEIRVKELSYMLREEGKGGIGGAVPEIDPHRNMAAYRALSSAMSDELVANAHDCSDGAKGHTGGMLLRVRFWSNARYCSPVVRL